MLPPVPNVEEPVRSVIMPLLPADVVPDVKEREPLTPLSPEFADRILNTPLEDARPYPEIIDTAPPVTCVLCPAFSAKRPPVPVLALPTTTLTLPAVPSVAEPVRSVMLPLLAVLVDALRRAAGDGWRSDEGLRPRRVLLTRSFWDFFPAGVLVSPPRFPRAV